MPDARIQDCTDEAVALVRRWIDASAGRKPEPGAARLAAVLADPAGIDFTLGFVDRVIRPEDPRVAARNLERLSQDVPELLAWYLRGAVTFGGGFAQMMPWAVIPTARRILRRMTGHLLVDATPAKLGAALARIPGSDGTDLSLTLLGRGVLGTAASDERIAGTMELLARDDVHEVAIGIRSVLPQLSAWAFDESVRRAVERLVPLFRLAAHGAGSVVLDVEQHRDLDVTIAVFRTLLDRPEFAVVRAGVVLPAAFPRTLRALDDLTAWAKARCARGGAPITVRLVKGAGVPLEQVDAILGARPLATWPSKRGTDAAYLRLLDAALDPDRTDAVTVGVATHNLFDLAAAWVLAGRRGVRDAVRVEMLLGMTASHADAVRADVGRIVLTTPVVHPDEFDGAIPYLARRLQEHASPEGFMTSAFTIDTDRSVFNREHDRFRAAVAAAATEVQGTNPEHITERIPTNGFRTTPDTDPADPAARRWAADVLRRVPGSTLGADTLRQARVLDRARIERTVAQTAQAGVNWGRQDPATRAELLDLIAQELLDRRTDLVEVMVSETGITLTEADAEVSTAVDHAHAAAHRARKLAGITGATFVPPRLTVVVPTWSSPVATPTSGIVGALAAGSGVVFEPDARAARSGAVLADVLRAAGVPQSLFAVVQLVDDDLRRDLVGHPVVDRVLFTGPADVARSFRWWRAGLPLTAATGGTNTIVVTPSADVDLAVQHVVADAFGRAGQQQSSASLVLLVGAADRTEHFRRQLVDAVRTLRVAWPDDPSAEMGPLVEEPRGAERSALTELGPGESWLVQPRPLDDSGRLWSPGVRDGVRPGSAFHQVEHAAPVLGIIAVDTLEDAIAIQNGMDSGFVAGLHSLDVEEIAVWVDRVRAGALFVGRGVTGAKVRRQAVGGWRRSSVGTGITVGGPMSVATLGRFLPVPRKPHGSIRLQGVPAPVATVIEAARTGMSFAEFDQVRAGALSDVVARDTEYGTTHDPSALVVERNVLRYRPQSVIVRQAEDASLGDLVRVLAAATAAHASVLVSAARPLPGSLVQLFRSGRSPLDVVDHVVESDAEWLRRAASGAVFSEQWSGPAADGDGATTAPRDDLASVLAPPSLAPRPHSRFGGPGARIRLVGGDPVALEEALGASIDVAIHDGPVVEAGIVEMLPFLREQVVSITTHRFGDVQPELADLRL